MTTLESRYNQRLREMTRETDKIEYILQTIPFIRQYTTHDDVSPAPVLHTAPNPARHRFVAGSIKNFATVTRRTNPSNAFQGYLHAVEHDEEATLKMMRQTPRDEVGWVMCEKCQSACVVDSRQSQVVCTSCGTCKTYLEAGLNGITHDQETQQCSVVNNFAYKRLNHFMEWLNSFQAKENTEIPAAVMDAVRAEFRKEGECKRSDIKHEKVRKFLKKLKLNKYYEHAHAICNALNGVPAPKLPQHLEDELRNMFQKIQEPYAKWKPPDRKNFLSYAYVLYKFCELLGADQYLTHFPLLKCRNKLHAHDQVWRNICETLGWQFMKTV